MSTEALKVEFSDEELEIARKAIENELVWRRDSRIFVLRGNGLSIRESDGSESSIIRMSSVEAMLVALEAVNKARGFE